MAKHSESSSSVDNRALITTQKSNEKDTSLLGRQESKVSGEKNQVIESSNASSPSKDDNVPNAVPIVDEVEQTNYMYMFAVMPRFNPINNWNKDCSEAFKIEIFESAAKRCRIPVGDNFDWIDFGKRNAISKKDSLAY